MKRARDWWAKNPAGILLNMRLGVDPEALAPPGMWRSLVTGELRQGRPDGITRQELEVMCDRLMVVSPELEWLVVRLLERNRAPYRILYCRPLELARRRADGAGDAVTIYLIDRIMPQQGRIHAF